MLKSRKYFLSLFNFNNIPPIIGMILSNKAGMSILTYENNYNKVRYGTIESYLNQEQEDILDLISMYLSSINSFAENVKIEDLRSVGIGGSNIKIEVFFNYKNYMIILFLNANTDLSLRIQDNILNHFEHIFEKYGLVFKNFNSKESIQIRRDLEVSGRIWLNQLNGNYIKIHERLFMAKYEKLEKFVNQFNPIINNALHYYLKYIPEDIKIDICREIKEKIEDKFLEYF